MSDKYLEIAGEKFRKTGAFSAALFGLGVIDKIGTNRFVPRGAPTINDHPVKVLTHYHTDETKKASIDARVEAGVESIEGVIGVKGGTDKGLKGKFAVIRNTENYKLVDRLNAPVNEELLKHLKKESKSPVIITAVAIVSDNDIYSKSDLSGELEASVTSIPGAPTIKLKGSSGSAVAAGFSDDTIFAYEYSRIYWDDESVTPKIEKIEVDKPNIF